MLQFRDLTTGARVSSASIRELVLESAADCGVNGLAAYSIWFAIERGEETFLPLLDSILSDSGIVRLTNG